METQPPRKKRKNSVGYPRIAVCQCGEIIVPVGGTPGACWQHEETGLGWCGYDDMGKYTWAKAVEVLDRGMKPRRKRRKKNE